MLKAARISALILLLACSARAGHMQTGGSPEPPPPSPSVSPAGEPTGSTEEPIADGNTQSEAAGVLTQVALDMLAALPSLF